jgi:SMODS and SLOG-associating 2TM effector domain 1
VVGAADKKALGDFDFVALTSVLTTIAGAVVAHIEASRYGFLVTTYRATARRLRNELTKAATFSAPSPEWSAFVNRCETILADEDGGWLAKWTK